MGESPWEGLKAATILIVVECFRGNAIITGVSGAQISRKK